MSKKKKKIEDELSNLTSSVNSILSQYKVLSNKEKKTALKDLKKREKKLAKKFLKTGESQTLFDLKVAKSKIKRIENIGDRIPINYGVFNFHIKESYFRKIKDKERYLDYLFSRKMKNVLSKRENPKTKNKAKELEGLITQYVKKIKNTEWFDENLVKNEIDKLIYFRNNVLTDYDYSDFIAREIRKRTATEKEKTEIDKEIESELYKAIEKPIIIDDILIGLQFNFF